jgi:hypothetical protein
MTIETNSVSPAASQPDPLSRASSYVWGPCDSHGARNRYADQDVACHVDSSNLQRKVTAATDN